MTSLPESQLQKTHGYTSLKVPQIKKFCETVISTFFQRPCFTFQDLGVGARPDATLIVIVAAFSILSVSRYTAKNCKNILVKKEEKCLKCYKLIQRFRVTGLIAGQYTTGYYGTLTDVI